MTNKRCKVLGYNVDLLNFKEAKDFVFRKIHNDIGLHIITINPEIIALADKSRLLANIINMSELVLPESFGIKMALEFKGFAQDRIAGIDFAKGLIKHCAKLNYPIALIGSKEEVLLKTTENLKREFPKLNIVYKHNGYFSNDNTIINELSLTKPKLVLCAMGAPKQEIFINKCSKIYKNSVYMGVGGSFDVWAGYVQRAPEVFQKYGLEWFYRASKQPSRIKRIFKTLPIFLFRAIMESIKEKN